MSNLFETMEKYSETTEHFMKKHTDAFYGRSEFAPYVSAVKNIFNSFAYSLYAGGKRLRPFLVLEFCKICGTNPSAAVSYAAAIEMIHTFSLIHDDLPCMDNDDLRRGKPSNHKVFGDACALLAGDALSLYAFEAAADNSLSAEQNVKAMTLLAKNAGICGMIAGQQIDMYAENTKNADIGLLTLLQNKKTGCLFETACLLGCIAAGKYENSAEYGLAVKFSAHIGLAFQITDDILDVCGDAVLLGKNIGSDADNGKSTFVTLLGLDGARKKAEDEIKCAHDVLNTLEHNGADVSALRELAEFILTRNS